jgi:hypothetical protein
LVKATRITDISDEQRQSDISDRKYSRKAKIWENREALPWAFRQTAARRSHLFDKPLINNEKRLTRWRASRKNPRSRDLTFQLISGTAE